MCLVIKNYKRLTAELRLAGRHQRYILMADVMNYLFYLMNTSGLIDSARTYRHTNDDVALAFAQGLAAATMVEVWQGDRRVGLVPPQRGGLSLAR